MTLAFANQQYPTDFDIPLDGTEHDVLATIGIDAVESDRGMATNGARVFRAAIDATKETTDYYVVVYGKVTPDGGWGIIYTPGAIVTHGTVFQLTPINVTGLFAVRMTVRMLAGIGNELFTVEGSMAS